MQGTKKRILQAYRKNGLSEIEKIAEEDTDDFRLSDERVKEEIWEKVQEYVHIIIERYGLKGFLLKENYDPEDVIRSILSFDEEPKIVKYLSPDLYDYILEQRYEALED